jgi:ribosomal protein S18 acetylase RimI-like enzyme
MKQKIYQLLEILNNEVDQKLVAVELNNYVEKIFEKSTIISIERNNNLQGFISYYDNDEKNESAFLTMIAIDKKYRHMGYGKGLLEFSVSILRTKGFKKYSLEVLKDNSIAINLYKRLGFIVTEERQQHYYMEMKL